MAEKHDKREGEHDKSQFNRPGQVDPSKWTVARPFDSADFVADPLPVQPPPADAEKKKGEA